MHDEWKNESINEWIKGNEWMKWMYEWMSEWMNHTINQSIIQSINQSAHQTKHYVLKSVSCSTGE